MLLRNVFRGALRAIPALAYGVLIWYISSLPQPLPSEAGAVIGVDKILHIGEFFIFGLLLVFAFKGMGWKGKTSNYLVCLLIAVVYGIIDEIHQLYVPTRFFSVYDMIADGAGGLIAIIFAKKISKD